MAIRQYLGTWNTYEETRTVAPRASGSTTCLGPATRTKTRPMAPPMHVLARRAWKLIGVDCSAVRLARDHRADGPDGVSVRKVLEQKPKGGPTDQNPEGM